MKPIRQRARVAVGATALGVMGVAIVVTASMHPRTSLSSSPVVGRTKMTSASIIRHGSTGNTSTPAKDSMPTTSVVPTTSMVPTASASAPAASASIGSTATVSNTALPSASVASTASTAPSTTAPASSPEALAPVLSSLSLSGETALGQSGAVVQYIWIYGSNFQSATGVRFGAVEVPIYARSGSNALEVAAPLQPVGSVDVRVVAGQLESTIVPSDTFRYVLAPLQ
ncbi:MAG: hypothetical protein ACP5O0_02710 [Acidimicrobiales bacterium]